MMTTGEVRRDMAAELGKSLEEVVNSKKALRQYYILIHVRWEGNGILKTRIIPMFKKDLPQIPLINTICYFIDNENETFRQLWCLPMDPEVDENGIRLLAGQEVESVLKSSRLLEYKIAEKVKGVH